MAAILTNLVLTGVMLLALFTRTPPHPPLETPLFALGPFLGASLAIGVAAFHLVRQDAQLGYGVTALFAFIGLLSFGPQKYFDPAFASIWPAVLTAQAAIVVMLVWCTIPLRRVRRVR
ncbi:MAG: hypothetical protein GKS00_04635 [Alphaproteobacteria bacterium]|nr:hypothetical protein [Alphaproteobacteria bacterium]